MVIVFSVCIVLKGFFRGPVKILHIPKNNEWITNKYSHQLFYSFQNVHIFTITFNLVLM